VESILNPYDEYGVEAAVQLKEAQGAEVTVLSMGPEAATEAVRKALAMGADQAVLVTDPVLAGSDAQATAYALAQALRGMEFDLVVFGAMSTDAQTGQVPAAVGELLGLPVLTNLSALDVADGAVEARRQTEEGSITYRTPLPALVAVAKGINEPRYPSMKGIMGAKKKPLETRSAADIAVDAAKVGLGASWTRVVGATAAPARAAGRRITDFQSPEEGAGLVADFLAEHKLL
jgi:electron transfer flavoprotein beta subunit